VTDQAVEETTEEKRRPVMPQPPPVEGSDASAWLAYWVTVRDASAYSDSRLRRHAMGQIKALTAEISETRRARR
jgi:hypothetical protein